jgi:uncharacterized protein
MATIGKFNTLTIVAIAERGAYLDAGELGEILLPNRYVPAHAAVGEIVNAFIYLDSADRIVATTAQPFAQVGEFASLKVIQINKMGAFLDWGLPKDLLVPYNQQHKKMEQDKYYLVRIYQDPYSNRIAASSKLDKYLNLVAADYHVGDKVELTIASRTDLGVKAIINNAHWGLIYQNEIFHPLQTGEKRYGFIKKVRSDGHIDLSLSQTGRAKINDFNADFLQYLAEHDGFCALHDKSSPEQIKQMFAVSKKTFKATIGHLMKQGKVTIESNGVRLV